MDESFFLLCYITKKRRGDPKKATSGESPKNKGKSGLGSYVELPMSIEQEPKIFGYICSIDKTFLGYPLGLEIRRFKWKSVAIRLQQNMSTCFTFIALLGVQESLPDVTTYV